MTLSKKRSHAQATFSEETKQVNTLNKKLKVLEGGTLLQKMHFRIWSLILKFIAPNDLQKTIYSLRFTCRAFVIRFGAHMRDRDFVSMSFSNWQQLDDVFELMDSGAASLDLNLCNNLFTSTTFRTDKFKYLVSLKISGCTQVVDDDISSLIHLRLLDISKCRGLTDKSISNMKDLEWFNMSGNRRITDATLSRLTTLKCLLMSECTQINDAGLMQLNQLRVLDCSHCPQITGDSFAYLTKLESLNLALCFHLTGKTLVPLGSHLKKLILSHNFMLDGKYLSSFNRLEYLDCFQTTIVGKHIDHLKVCLRTLVVEKSRVANFSNIHCNIETIA